MGRIWFASLIIPVLPMLPVGLDTTVLTRSQVSAVESCGEEQAEADSRSPAASKAVVSFFMIPSVVD
jgi:hypothetical protein